MANGNPRTNHEGYSDPTAYEAIKNTEADDERFHKLLNTIFTICELSGVSSGGTNHSQGYTDRESLEVK